MPDKHYRMSPSSSSRWLRCPGSAREDLPDRGSTAAAEEGTIAHEWCRVRLLYDTKHRPPDPEMERAVEEYVEFVAGLPEGKRVIETLIESSDIPDFGGTIDCLIVTDDEIYVVDFKYGKYPVSVVDNKQIMSYLSLAREAFPGRKKYYGGIVQPRVGPAQLQEFSRASLNSHAEAVLKASKSSDLCAGDQCKWCPLVATCAVAAAKARDMAAEVFSEDKSIDECLEVMGFVDVVVEMAKIAKTRLIALAMKGERIPGFKLVRSLGHRTWKDKKKAEETLKETTPEGVELYDIKLKSPAQMEKVVEKGEIEKLTIRPDRGVTIVSESSKTPEYIPGQQFPEIEE